MAPAPHASVQPFLSKLDELTQLQIDDEVRGLVQAVRAEHGRQAYRACDEERSAGGLPALRKKLASLGVDDEKLAALDDYIERGEALAVEIETTLALRQPHGPAAADDARRCILDGHPDHARSRLEHAPLGRDWGSLMFGAIFILPGLFFLFIGIRDVGDARASEGWVEAPGTILTSKVEKSVSSSHSRNGRRGGVSSSGSSTTTWGAAILYEYQVDGQRHEGDRVAFEYDGSKEGAEATVAEYPPGKAVTVFYDPEDPDDSVLEAGMTSSTYAGIPLGVAFIIAGIVIGLWQPNKRRRGRKGGRPPT